MFQENIMPSKSKIKGSSFENELAKFLSSLYGESFVRIPNSGAYIGGANTFRKNRLSENQIKSFKGDIVPPDSWIYFNAEAKNYADFPFHQVLTGKCKQLDTWLEQLMVVAEPNDVNILCFKINRKGKFVCVQSKLAWKSNHFIYYSSEKFQDWIIMEFDHFFELNKEVLKGYSSTRISDTKSIIIENADTKSITNLTSNTLLNTIPL